MLKAFKGIKGHCKKHNSLFDETGSNDFDRLVFEFLYFSATFQTLDLQSVRKGTDSNSYIKIVLFAMSFNFFICS